MDHSRGRSDMHVIVTGGSSGIGLEVARIYGQRGARLTLIGRDADRLDAARRELVDKGGIPEGNIHTGAADTGSGPDVTEVIKSAEDAFGPCDILVTSAGIVDPGMFDQLSSKAFDYQVTTNVLGIANSVRAVYSGMKARGQGRIMIISSGAALIGIYGYTAYCASKSALTGFAEALSFESIGTGVDICLCFPPDTFTPQFEREIARRSREAQMLMGKVAPWSADTVARKIVHAIDRRKAKLYFGFSLTALGLYGPFIKPFLHWWYRRRLG